MGVPEPHPGEPHPRIRRVGQVATGTVRNQNSMATTQHFTVIGNLTADPELRYTQNGIPVVNFTVAETPRIFDRQANEWKDGEASFFRASAWRTLAEHIAGSYAKGHRVIVTGQIRQRTYQDREGNNRVTFEIEVDDIGGSVKYGVTSFTRSASNQQEPAQSGAWSASGNQPQTAAQPQTPADAWAPAGASGYTPPAQGQQAQAPSQQPQGPSQQPQALQTQPTFSGFGDDTPF